MFKIDEKLKKIVAEDIEKVEVETSTEEITVETDGDAVKVEIEPKGDDCAACETPVESAVDLDNYAFFSNLNPEVDIDDEVVDEGFLGIKTKKEKEKEAKAKAEKERQKQRDKELKDEEERARQQATIDSWARYNKAERDAKAEYNKSNSSQSSKVSNTGKAGVYYSGGDYYSEDLNKSKSIKESKDIDPIIWKAIGRHFEYTISEKAAEIVEGLADRALAQDNVEDTYEAVVKAIDEGLFYTADIWEINALYDECELSDNAYNCLVEDLVQIVDTIHSGALDESLKLTEKLDFKYIKALKDKLAACYTRQDLEEIGADLTNMDEVAIDRVLAGDATESDIEKMFGHYAFVDDDFHDLTESGILTHDDAEMYLARAMHKMYIDGYEFDEIADVLGCDYETVNKLIGPDSYDDDDDDNLTESKSIKKSNIKKEDITVHCDKCNQDVTVDNNFECPTCSSNNLLDKVVENVMDPSSKYIIIFNDNTGIIGIADKTRLGRGHEIEGSDRPVVGITKEFYDSLKATIHDRTSQSDHRGGFTLDNLKGTQKTIVSRLKDFA